MHNSLVLRARPIIVEWERDARHSAGLSLVRVAAGGRGVPKERRAHGDRTLLDTRFRAELCPHRLEKDKVQVSSRSFCDDAAASPSTPGAGLMVNRLTAGALMLLSLNT
ncbi:hypothetical protein EVAR_55057_1 [Eumeta japonica]|uniref:Uncharacterized protein n=1 Tax=Eumeta variegata TaxID=151549 RepID=A0A4C1Z5C7_EUMVA|nr:hypothetical protein EVAR_55057_1 [Eumeta japonica]